MIRTEPVLAIAIALFVPRLATAQLDRYQPDVPRDLVSKMEAARSLRRQGKAEDAAALLRTIVQVRPDYYLAQYNLGIALAEARDYTGSTSAFNKAVAIKEEKKIPDASVYNSAGWSYLLARNYKRAEELLLEGRARFAELSPTSRTRIENNLGLLYLYSGDFERSAAHLAQAKARGSTLAEQNLKLLETTKAARRQPAPK